MSKPRHHTPQMARIMRRCEVPAYIGRSLTWFAEHRVELERAGFPTPLPLVDGYDRVAIDAWLDNLGGLRVLADDRPTGWDGAADGAP